MLDPVRDAVLLQVLIFAQCHTHTQWARTGSLTQHLHRHYLQPHNRCYELVGWRSVELFSFLIFPTYFPSHSIPLPRQSLCGKFSGIRQDELIDDCYSTSSPRRNVHQRRTMFFGPLNLP
ncbi:hypothetical protein BP00DRAFT_51685 [Aspergillus indologenus CBS 114.80]|uniref:Uncharacterized protein n=1 Tax=Aspergillus indologenus CBS 114.80 TaxID=1450541 RepID=A0A2V5HQ95_9EURO|nr:hypothetical protein BP00DRAFT_51685 [Aspergillus indologenus CBS 114.80]